MLVCWAANWAIRRGSTVPLIFTGLRTVSQLFTSVSKLIVWLGICKISYLNEKLFFSRLWILQSSETLFLCCRSAFSSDGLAFSRIFTDPWRIIVSWRLSWPKHRSFLLLTVANSCSCLSVSTVIRYQTNSLFLRSLRDIQRNHTHFISRTCMRLIAASAVSVRNSQSYKAIDVIIKGLVNLCRAQYCNFSIFRKLRQEGERSSKSDLNFLNVCTVPSVLRVEPRILKSVYFLQYFAFYLMLVVATRCCLQWSYFSLYWSPLSIQLHSHTKRILTVSISLETFKILFVWLSKIF